MSDSSSALALAIIRLALILGVLAAGVVFWIVLDRMEEPMLQPDVRRPVRLALFGFWAVLALAIAFVRRKRSGTEGQRARALTIVGWALAQAIGLAGVVYYFLTGALLFMAAGLVLQIVISFAVLPPPSWGR